MPLIPGYIRDKILASVQKDGEWRSTGPGYSHTFTAQQIASLRTWAQRNGMFVSTDELIIVVTSSKPDGIGATIAKKIAAGETAFVVHGNASTIRNYIAKWNKWNDTDWKVSQKEGGKSFVIYKLPTKKTVDDPIRGDDSGPFPARNEDC